MKKVKTAAFALMLAIAFSISAARKSYAYIVPIPVTDAMTLAQNITNDIKLVLEAKFVAETMRLSGRLNSTLGNSPFDPHKIFEDGYISKGEDEGAYGED